MNEVTFFFHLIALIGFILISVKIGKYALTAALTVQVILANLFVMKQMTCFGLNVTCSEVYTIGSIFSINLIQVYFGKKSASHAIKITFFFLFLVGVMSQFHIRYTPSKYDDGIHGAFASILGHSPRIMITSFVSTYITQRIDIECFGWIKKKVPHTLLFLPFVLTSLFTQLLDTVLFSFVALYGIVHSVKDIILMSYLIKIIIIFTIAPFTLLVRKWIRHDPVQV